MKKIYHIDKEISTELASAFADFAATLTEDDTLTLMVNSNGGSVTAGFALYDMVKGLPNETECNIIGCAASAATYVCLACDKVVMQPSATFMIHEVQGWIGGTPREIERDLAYMVSLQDRMIAMYAEKAQFITLAQIEEMVENTTFLNAQEALDYGFVDHVPGLTRNAVEEASESQEEQISEQPKEEGFVNRILSIFNKPKGEVFHAPTDAEIAANEEIQSLNNKLQEAQMQLDNAFKSLDLKENEFEAMKNQAMEEIDRAKAEYEKKRLDMENSIQTQVHNRLAALGYDSAELPTPKTIQNNSDMSKFYAELGIE